MNSILIMSSVGNKDDACLRCLILYDKERNCDTAAHKKRLVQTKGFHLNNSSHCSTVRNMDVRAGLHLAKSIKRYEHLSMHTKPDISVNNLAKKIQYVR